MATTEFKNSIKEKIIRLFLTKTERMGKTWRNKNSTLSASPVNSLDTRFEWDSIDTSLIWWGPPCGNWSSFLPLTDSGVHSNDTKFGLKKEKTVQTRFLQAWDHQGKLQPNVQLQTNLPEQISCQSIKDKKQDLVFPQAVHILLASCTLCNETTTALAGSPRHTLNSPWLWVCGHVS